MAWRMCVTLEKQKRSHIAKLLFLKKDSLDMGSRLLIISMRRRKDFLCKLSTNSEGNQFNSGNCSP